MKELILVNGNDEVTGYGDKTDIHRKGLLHRAFSILVVNSRGELLLQKRASGKYHSGGLWTNTCCSHPLRDQTTGEAARNRLREEMGFDCGLNFAFKFLYKARFGNGLTEHELDHVFTGRYDGPVQINPAEVEDYRWADADAVRAGMSEAPEAYTVWFRLIMERIGFDLKNIVV